MGSSVKGEGAFAAGVWLRAGAIGILVFAALYLAVRHQLYATAAVLLLVSVVVGLDLARAAAAADRLLALFVDGLISEGRERPTAAGGVGQLAEAIERAFDRLGRARAERQGRIDFLQALADNLAAPLLVVAAEGEIVLANRAAVRRFGEMSGRLDRAAALGEAAGARLMALPAGGREVVRLADGRSMLAQAAAFAGPAGERYRLISLQGVATDLDAVELKAWQDLVRVLAHEMMNSLTPICSLAESLAARKPGPEETAEAAEVIARRSAGLMNFVARYRAIADLPAPSPGPIAAADLAASLEGLMAPLMAEAAVAFACRVEPAGLTFEADEDLLEQALINLVKNAMEAAKGGEGASVRLTCSQAEGEVVLAVEDNGPGLAVDDPDAVFVPFYTTKAGGSGIGLTLARQIALAHGGRLEHEPAKPAGAVFRLILPT